MRLLPALLAIAILAAGCVTTPGDETPGATAGGEGGSSWDAIRAQLAGVGCEAESVDAGTSSNMVPLGSLLFEEGDIGEMDVRDDVALVARYQLGGFHVVDLADPREPALISTLEIEGGTAYDVKWLPDGRGAVIGAGEGKLYLVDLADLAAPVVVSEAEVATQAHMVTPWTFEDNRTFVYVASQTTNMPAFVYELTGWDLELVGAFGLPTGPIQSLALGNHDLTIYEDELLGGEPVLYMADGLAGWNAWSLADPAAPARIGGSIGQELGVGYVHTVRVGFFDGHRIVITMQEVGQNTLKIYDATDLEMPVLLARWNADPTAPQIPQHNIQLLGEWLFLAHYARGVYVFNLSAVISGPALLGTALLSPAAHWAVDDPADGGALGFANIWDVSVRRGVVYATDRVGTLESVAFACLPLGDAAASATA